MAAYAALLSLMHTIDQIQTHPKPPISLDKTFAQSLTEKLSFLRDFLENYGDPHAASQDFEGLESRMAAAAYEAEDIIESHIVDQLQPPNHEEDICPIGLYDGLEKVMQDLDLIKVDAADIMKNERIKPERSYSMPVGQPGPPLAKHSITVGLDEVLNAAIDKLTGHQSGHKIIPIVGMGGIGKTTLARTLYEHQTIKEHFDLRGWATISQQYDSKGILVEVLACLGKGDSKQREEHELGEMLHKTLYGRRYLIVMDDIWSIQAWDKVWCFFPDTDNGRRIVITTRLSDLALELSGDRGIEIGFLDEDKSWDLLRKCVFGEEDCPMELNEIGKQIARSCKGLPLSIVVIGGLLAKSEQTKKHWQSIKENLNSLVNLSDNEHCLRILRMSYNHLPVHLKPCFLYMGIFPEDHLFAAFELVILWIAEGFLKPISNKTMEATAEEYLKDLAQRNLILFEPWHDRKYYRIHDVLRELCIKEAEDRFFRVAALDGPNTKQNWHTQRRIGIHCRESSSRKQASRAIRNDVGSAALARSLVFNVGKVVSSRNSCRLLRVFHHINNFIREYNYSLGDIFRRVNSRHIVLPAKLPKSGQFPSSIYHLWNLQTLVVRIHNPNSLPNAPMIDIWRMPRLRHVDVFYFRIPDPPTGDDDSSILPDLQTLQTVYTSKWCNQTIKRIPNIKDLGIRIPYNESSSIGDYELANLGRQRGLETLVCSFGCTDDSSRALEHDLARSLAFPNSLRKLRLFETYFLLEDLAAKVGHLPHLQVLDLNGGSCKGTEWKTVEGQFRSLKVLSIHNLDDLEDWIMEDCTHFPILEHLFLLNVPNLKAIPLVIGELTTMKSIKVIHCKESAVISAKKIEEVQKEYGNDDFGVLFHQRVRKES